MSGTTENQVGVAAMGLRSGSEAEEYVRRHNLRELTTEWIDSLGATRPDDPFRELIALIERHIESSSLTCVCENPWCEGTIPVADYDEHLKICSPERWNKCLRCDTRVEVTKMAQHRQHCHLQTCAHCGEYVLPRMAKLCPLLLLKGLSSRVEHVEVRRTASLTSISQGERKVRHLQRLWRTVNAQRNFRRLAFKVIWNLMDSAREVRMAHGALQQAGSVSALQRFLSGSVSRAAHGPSMEVTLSEQEQRVQACHPPDELADLLEQAARGEIIDADIASDLIHDATRILACRPAVVHLATPYNGEVVVVGDLHGQLKDLLHILRTEGLPGESKRFVFNGDFVDRGPQGCEVLLLIFALLCTTPSSVFLNRGNHEDIKINREYGFLVEIRAKYEDAGDDLYELMLKAFKVMPLVHVIDKRIMVVHGGLPRNIGPIERINNIGHIRCIPTVEQVDEDEELLVDLVWSDPVDRFKSRHFGMRHQGKHWRTSARGCGIEYLSEHTKEYLAANNLELVIRSHEMVAAGYERCHEGRCYTVFSASDYCGVSGNRGAVCVFSYLQPEPVFRTWYLRDGADRELGNISFLDSAAAMEMQNDGDPMDIVGGVVTIDRKHPDAECIDCLRQIREMVWQSRYKLMTNFSTADAQQTGFVSKVEWCEIMRRTLELDVKWYFLAHYLVDTVIHHHVPCVRYTQFLTSIDSRCSSMFLNGWMVHKISDVFSRLDLPDDFIPSNFAIAQQEQRRLSSVWSPSHHRKDSSVSASDKPPRALPPAPPAPAPPDDAACSSASGGGGGGGGGGPPRFARSTVVAAASPAAADSAAKDPLWRTRRIAFNYFASTLRSKSVVAAKMDDNELFVLFAHFDHDLDGQLVLGEMVADVKKSRDAARKSQKEKRKGRGKKRRASKSAATSGAHASADGSFGEVQELQTSGSESDGGSNSGGSSSSGSDESDVEVEVVDFGNFDLGGVSPPSTAAAATPAASAAASAVMATCTAVQHVKDSIVITRPQACKEEWMYTSMLLLQKFFLYGRTRGLEASFQLLDRDHSGTIDFQEFRRMLRHLNRSLPTPLKESQMEEMFRVIDADRSGEVDMQEFLTYFSVVDLRKASSQPRRSMNSPFPSLGPHHPRLGQGFVAAIRSEVERSPMLGESGGRSTPL